MQHGWTRLGGDPARQSSAPDYWRGAAVGFAGSPWSERRRRSPLGRPQRWAGVGGREVTCCRNERAVLTSRSSSTLDFTVIVARLQQFGV
jgi:hypothetical protein